METSHHHCCQCQPVRICVPVADGLLFIRHNDIVRCEGDNNYTHLHLVSGKRITVSKTLKVFERMLPATTFARVHQSHMVNVNFIVKYTIANGTSVSLADNTLIPVSKSRKEELLELLRTDWSNEAPLTVHKGHHDEGFRSAASA